MKKFILIIIAALLPLGLFAQGNPAEKGASPEKPAKEALMYVIKPKFPTNVYMKYTVTDVTKVTRYLSEYDSLAFEREIVYFMTLRAPDWRKEDGALDIFVSIDSMAYKLKDKDTSYAYDSRDEEALPPYTLNDFDFRGIPLGLEYEVTLSNYNEIIGLKSEALKNKREYVADPVKGIRDEFRRFYWQRGLSDRHNAYISDPQKGLLPDNKIQIDSSWTDIVSVRLDDAFIEDTVKLTLKSFNISSYMIEGESMGSYVPKGEEVILHKINKIAKVDGGSSKGNYKVKVSAQGLVEALDIHHEGELSYLINRDKFRQKIVSDQKWELTGILKW